MAANIAVSVVAIPVITKTPAFFTPPMKLCHFGCLGTKSSATFTSACFACWQACKSISQLLNSCWLSIISAFSLVFSKVRLLIKESFMLPFTTFSAVFKRLSFSEFVMSVFNYSGVLLSSVLLLSFFFDWRAYIVASLLLIVLNDVILSVEYLIANLRYFVLIESKFFSSFAALEISVCL